MIKWLILKTHDSDADNSGELCQESCGDSVALRQMARGKWFAILMLAEEESPCTNASGQFRGETLITNLHT